jgi:hypothetical protein
MLKLAAQILAALAALAAIICLIVAVSALQQDMQPRQENADQFHTAEALSSTAIALQEEQVDALQRVMAVQGPEPESGPTATALAQQVSNLTGTSEAIEAERRAVQLNQTAFVQATSPATIVPSTTESDPYAGWLICWHGVWDHEYVVAYPLAMVQQGLDLDTPLVRPWDGVSDKCPNDSLKICLLNQAWHGSPYPDWFPRVSHVRLENGGLVEGRGSEGASGRNRGPWRLRDPEYAMRRVTGGHLGKNLTGNV